MTAGSAIGSGGPPACRRGEPPAWLGLRGLLLLLELLAELPWLMASRDRRRMATRALDAASSVEDAGLVAAAAVAAASAPAFGLLLPLRGPRVKLLTA